MVPTYMSRVVRTLACPAMHETSVAPSVGDLDVLAGRDRADDRGHEPLAPPALGVRVLAGPAILYGQAVE